MLHSALSDVERAREWQRVRSGEARVVVGTRSAIFAPLENLGLVIVDEEQENSYKQEETPRYHGRDVAIVRAKLESALALLGSATPSLETYHHAGNGKYDLLTMLHAWNRTLAASKSWICATDFQQTQKANPISQRCTREYRSASRLKRKRSCSSTGGLFLVRALPELRSGGAMRKLQHLDDLSQEPQPAGMPLLRLDPGGAESMPEMRVAVCVLFWGGLRASRGALEKGVSRSEYCTAHRDTARTKRQYQETLGAFAGGALDILVGTQMLAKGHDFQRVTLVGEISADSSLSLPDFRAAERTFQLLTQWRGVRDVAN